MKSHQFLQETGISYSDLQDQLQTLKAADAKWDEGKVFGFVYHPGAEYVKISETYQKAFLYESTLNPSTFPSLLDFQKDITAVAKELMHGDDQTVGNVTSGGSESILLALKVARDSNNKSVNDIGHPEIVIPETAHPAFLKACHLLGINVKIIPVSIDKRADVKAMEDAITENTILLACSAPCFPYGVVDPVTEIGVIAQKHKLQFHVDACMGGFMLPFIEDLGHSVPLFDFRVSGVTSISLDAHKYGYAPKGVSIILYKSKKLRRRQFFVHTDWPGGIFATTTVLGTKGGAPLAGCWAIMNHLGREGYRSIAGRVMKTTKSIIKGINAHEHLHLIGDPDMSIFSFTSDKGDIFNIGDALTAKGWHLDRLQFPNALHLTVTQLNVGKEKEFLNDLDEVMKSQDSLDKNYKGTQKSVKLMGGLAKLLPDSSIEKLARKAGKQISKKGVKDKIPESALYGISASFKNRKNVKKIILNLLDGMYQSLVIGLFLSLFMLSGQMSLQAQDITQTIRGRVFDSETNAPLLGATIAVFKDSIMQDATTTDMEGFYRIEDIPVGRYTLACSYLGYMESAISDVIVNSVKEVILPIKMEESSLEIEEIQVKATMNKGNAMNKLAYVSARSFSVEESDRYAGSRGDPARMAANYAGVQGNDDSNNDLIIRGNSPLGVLWRYEGVNIPNPNHFAVSGTTGGPVSILNNKVLSLSDFMTGAFPAEYGNSVAGVFDLKMRNGNNEHHEFSAQLGFLGTEALAEGPLKKSKRSSYLASYRYSTINLFHAFGISIGTDAVPRYQDGSFKLNFPLKNNANLSFFGIGGISGVDILASEQIEIEPDVVFGNQAMDEHFRTRMGVLGTNYSKQLSSNSFLRVTLSVSREHQSNHLDKVFRHIVDSTFVIDSIRKPHIGYYSNQNKYSAAINWNKRLNRKHHLKSGLIQDLYHFDMNDSIYNEVHLEYVTRLDHKGYTSLTQPYIQWKYRSSDRFTITGGIHGQFLNLEENTSWSIEPRAGVRMQASKRHAFGFGSGLHSQMVPTYVYFARLINENGKLVQPNIDLTFMKSFQNVLSWDYQLDRNLRIKAETYYQYLYDIPVEYRSSSYSVVDEGHDLNRFFPDSLINKGTANNYGVELTMEKFFSKSYFLLVTASLYDATRKGSDGVKINSVFNGGYIINALGSKEFTWNKKRNNSLTLGGKITVAGGKRYTPIDLIASDAVGEAVYNDELRNTKEFDAYLRFDVKLNYRINAFKVSHEIGLDMVNLTNRKNVLKQTYTNGADPPLQESYQLGLLPIFYYKIDF